MLTSALLLWWMQMLDMQTKGCLTGKDRPTYTSWWAVCFIFFKDCLKSHVCKLTRSSLRKQTKDPHSTRNHLLQCLLHVCTFADKKQPAPCSKNDQRLKKILKRFFCGISIHTVKNKPFHYFRSCSLTYLMSNKSTQSTVHTALANTFCMWCSSCKCTDRCIPLEPQHLISGSHVFGQLMCCYSSRHFMLAPKMKWWRKELIWISRDTHQHYKIWEKLFKAGFRPSGAWIII